MVLKFNLCRHSFHFSTDSQPDGLDSENCFETMYRRPGSPANGTVSGYFLGYVLCHPNVVYPYALGTEICSETTYRRPASMVSPSLVSSNAYF